MPRPKGSKNRKTLEREQQLGLPAPAPPSVAADDLPPLQEEPVPAPESEPEAPPVFVEFTTSAGERWRIERGRDLCGQFGIEAAELAAWHTALAPESRVWPILRLHYGISPLVGERTLDYLRPNSLEEIGKRLSFTPGQVQAEIDAARAFWMRWKQAQITREPTPEVPLARCDASARETLLRKYNFDKLGNESEQIYVADRLGDFEGQLQDEQGKILVTRAIRMELQLALYDRLILNVGAKAEHDPKARSELQSYIKTQQEINGQYLKVMEALEATHAQSTSAKKRMAFVDSLGTLVRAIQDYEGEGDRELLDGIHTAAEIILLTTPMTVRPPQYRPDIVALLHDALEPHNLWNPEYVPPQFERSAYRRFMAAVTAGLESGASRDGVVADFPDSDNEEGTEAEGQADPVAAPVSPQTGEATAAPASMPSGGSSPGHYERKIWS